MSKLRLKPSINIMSLVCIHKAEHSPFISVEFRLIMHKHLVVAEPECRQEEFALLPFYFYTLAIDGEGRNSFGPTVQEDALRLLDQIECYFREPLIALSMQVDMEVVSKSVP